jgi:hypothetical protein
MGLGNCVSSLDVCICPLKLFLDETQVGHDCTESSLSSGF